MPSKIQCFWLEQTDLVRESLRRFRYTTRGICKLTFEGYPGAMPHEPCDNAHNAEQVIVEVRPRVDGDTTRDSEPAEKEDPRWPRSCRCGYQFADDDQWQFNIRSLFRSTTGALYTLNPDRLGAPVGAMWDAVWYGDHHRGTHRNADGRYLVVRTPAGDWPIDGPSSNCNGDGWQRVGIPPRITVTPSIGFGDPQRMHGWLRDGVLDLDKP